MSISNEVTHKVGKIRNLLAELERLIAANVEVVTVNAPLSRIVESIPYKVTSAHIGGMEYATVMQLEEGRDFVIPNFWDRYKGKYPKIEWLCGTADGVAKYCSRAQFSVKFAPYNKNNDKKYCSELIIFWNPEDIDQRTNDATVDAKEFLAGLQKTAEAACTPKQLLVRARLSKLSDLLPDMLRTIQEGALRNERETLVFDHWERSWLDKSEECRPAIVRDAIDFYKLLGLKVRVEAGHWSSSAGGSMRYEVFVSGWHAIEGGKPIA